MKKLLVCLLNCILAACQAGSPTGVQPENPLEVHIIAENNRFANLLHVNVKGVLTDEIYNVPSSDGKEIVPAAGWYKNGTAYYWRPFVVKQTLDYGTRLAAHEVCHAKEKEHNAVHAACVNMLLGA